LYSCSKCNGNLRIEYDYQKIGKNVDRKFFENSKVNSIWRYERLLPVKPEPKISTVGCTPFLKAESLSSILGLKTLYIKDDTRNPSLSLKDRASIIALKHAIESKAKVVVGASTGNAGSSTACLAAALKVKTVIFVPESAPAAKIAQLQVFGSNLICVNGTYDDAFEMSLKATEKFGWYNRNTGFNPYTREGKKTVSFEICENLNWKVPDVVAVPVGDGNIISGVWKGFQEFLEIGLIDKLPRLLAVQAAKSNAIKLSFDSKNKIKPVSGETVADSISVSIPRDGVAAVNAISESNGAAVSVEDSEILDSIAVIAKHTGIFVEPAAAASYAGVRKAIDEKIITSSDSVVMIFTGNGLKDIESVKKIVKSPIMIENEATELDKIKI
jgi:threonine synthase